MPRNTTTRRATRTVSVTAAVLLLASACGGPEPTVEPADDTLAPDGAVTATTESVEAELVTETEASTADPTPVTAATPTPTTVVETEAETLEAPVITVWLEPREYNGAIRSAWTVDTEEAQCQYDLVGTDGDVIGTGVSEFDEYNTFGRGIRVEHDPDTDGEIGSFVIRCSLLGGPESSLEHSVRSVNYQNRSENGVLPADDAHYFDHDEVAALFPECGPKRRRALNWDWPYSEEDHAADFDGDGDIDYHDWLETSLEYYDRVFENWDTDVHEVTGRQVASGWWTTEQLRMYHPNSTITPDSVREEAFYTSKTDLLWLVSTVGRSVEESYRPWVKGPQEWPFDGETYTNFEDLYLRLNTAAGWTNVYPKPLNMDVLPALVTDVGIVGVGPNPADLKAGYLLWDWMDVRYNYPPVDREPTAWAMRTLLENRNANCVARLMREHCESGEFHSSPHMRHPALGGSRLGSVLWSAVCPEIAPEGQ